jgi:hypothetical protein
VLLILYASGFLVRNRYGISVIVKNNTEYEINDLQITDESHAETHKFALPHGARRRLWVNPAGETSIFLRFTDHQNIQRREVIAGIVAISLLR